MAAPLKPPGASAGTIGCNESADGGRTDPCAKVENSLNPRWLTRGRLAAPGVSNGLENRCTRERTVGSNPTPSAILPTNNLKYLHSVAEAQSLPIFLPMTRLLPSVAPAATFRPMARKRRPGPRTKCGQLSKAYSGNPACRDRCTPEFEDKRAALINGSDPQLAATASGILLANGFLTRNQHASATGLCQATCDRVRSTLVPAMSLGLGSCGRRSDPPEELVIKARHRLDEMHRQLTPLERQAVANVAVFQFIPQWFYTVRLKLRPLASDERERPALLSGLDALAK